MIPFLAFLRRQDGALAVKSLRAGIWVALSALIGAPLSFIRTIILARLLTPEIFGLWAICMMVLRGVDVLTQTGFGAALIHRQTGWREAGDTAFTLAVLRGVALTLVTLVLAGFVARFYENELLQALICVLALSFAFSGFQNINTVFYQKELNFQRLVYLEQAQLIFNFVLVVGLAYYFRSIWALVLGQVISAAVSSLLTFVIIPGRPRFALQKKYALELFHYGKYITGLTIVVFLTTEIDNAVIGKILGMETLGFYVVAYTVANLPATHIAKILSKILFPAYSQLQDNLPALRNAFVQAITYVSLITVPLAVFFIVLANEVITVIYGERWLPAAEALMILSVFGCLRAISSLNGYLYNAIGKTNIPFWLNLAKLVAIAAAIVPATRHYGIAGVAVVITGALLLQYLVSLSILSKILHVTYWALLQATVRFAAISAVVGTVLYYLKGSGLVVSPLVTLVSLFALGAGLYCLFCFRDLREAMMLFRKRQSCAQR